MLVVCIAVMLMSRRARSRSDRRCPAFLGPRDPTMPGLMRQHPLHQIACFPCSAFWLLATSAPRIPSPLLQTLSKTQVLGKSFVGEGGAGGRSHVVVWSPARRQPIIHLLNRIMTSVPPSCAHSGVRSWPSFFGVPRGLFCFTASWHASVRRDGFDRCTGWAGLGLSRSQLDRSSAPGKATSPWAWAWL